MTRSQEIDEIEVFTPEFLVDPLPGYEELRRTKPVSRVRMPSGELAWLITRYEDVRRGLSDPRFTNDQLKLTIVRPFDGLPDDVRPEITRDMLNSGAERHGRLRRMVADVFTPRRAEDLRQWMRERCQELLDELAGRESFDLAGEFAAPLVAAGVERTVGVPSGDWRKFRAWSRQITTTVLRRRDEALLRPALRLHGYVKELIEYKRANPADDLLTRLVQADERGEFDFGELPSMVRLLLIAGQEGPENLIGSGTLVLLNNPGQLELLRNEPQLIVPAVEELLRYNAPLGLSVYRAALEPVEIGGFEIAAGDAVVFSLLSSGHDSEQFENPSELDIRNGDQNHLGFGRGAHYCLGAAMGRVMVQEAIGGLVNRFEHLALACPVADVAWKQSVITRGLAELPVTTRAPAADGHRG